MTAHRKQTLSLITLENISKTDAGFEIAIPQIVKTSRPGTYQPLLLLPHFDVEPELCVARTLERYLALTGKVRGTIQSLFITTTKPFKPASRNTISNWLKNCLRKAGIAGDFAPHSIRHASTSKAFERGISVEVIKKLAGWSQRSTVFDRFYNRPIVRNTHEFARTVLSEL